ncbi:MAG TPA: molybdenum cofactor biosynthesis protein MoaE [Acidimicrobiales bacterium]|nr:molybdenum cofactor biosynthesis protein MoaE [Acidimicrobiales bacterium]
MESARAPDGGHDWLGLTTEPLPFAVVGEWAVLPSCGAVVVFAGTVRDHAEGRPGVTGLAYEAYVEQVEPKLAAVAAAARRCWPLLGRIALLHRIGPLELTDVAVLVAVSAPHRPEAFEAARWCIDTIKADVPIWKQETWSEGVAWGLTDAECGTEVRR